MTNTQKSRHFYKFKKICSEANVCDEKEGISEKQEDVW
jgi:hypothetical protein